jgi:tRNA modification GTPase
VIDPGRATIVALATPLGRGALAVVRLSGPDAHEVARRVAQPMRGAPLAPGRPRHVALVHPVSGPFDDGVAWLALGPSTATGEDTAELSCHGNPLLAERLVDAALHAGARLAHPGEFTRRAVEHGRLDLTAAEGVAQLVEARTLDGVALAREAVEGRLTEAFDGLRGRLVGALAELEVRLDYPEEDVDPTADRAAAEIGAVASEARAMQASWRLARVAVQGARVALVGPVNAGKSSLFNQLLGQRRALVHERPGTTRDVLEVAMDLDGVAVTLLDTAGERETDDPIEAAGLALAAELVADVDLVLVVLRARATGPDEVEADLLARTAGRARVLVVNRVDEGAPQGAPEGAVWTSARTGQGIDALKAAVRAAVAPLEGASTTLRVASARQRDLLGALAAACEEAAIALPVAGPAVAIELVHAALAEVDALRGRDGREDVLDAVFARFCLGK